MRSVVMHAVGLIEGAAFATLLCIGAGQLSGGVVGQAVESTVISTEQLGGRKVSAIVTAYCPCRRCCGKYADGITATGRNAYTTRGVAVDGKLIKKGSWVTIPGVGKFLADDVGGAMRQSAKKGRYHVDLRFSTHEEALQWGRKELDIFIQKDSKR